MTKHSEALVSDCGKIYCTDCAEPVKQSPKYGGWFITIGHAGFNSTANNRWGYKTKGMAVKAHRKYQKGGR